MKKQIISALLVSSLLSGCAFQKQLHQVVIDQNRMVANTANEIAFLNILRAKERLPMHFTRLNELRGNASFKGDVSADFLLPGTQNVLTEAQASGRTFQRSGARDTASPSAGVSLSTNPQTVVQVLDDKDFQNGIMTPVSADLVEYYLQQGWKDDFLSAIFIQKIEFSNGDKKIATLWNVPNGPDTSFAKFLRSYQLTPSKVKTERKDIIAMDQLGEKPTLASLSILDGKKFDIEKLTNKRIDRTIYRPGETIHSVKIARRSGIVTESIQVLDEEFHESEKMPLFKTLDCVPKDSTVAFSFEPSIANHSEDRNVSFEYEGAKETSCRIVDPATNPNGIPVSARIYLRSPEAILYFLGQYVREGKGYGLPNSDQLINIVEGKKNDAVVSARVNGKYYSMMAPIGKIPDHRGTQALGIIQQLINLHKSSEKGPTTTSVVVSQ